MPLIKNSSIEEIKAKVRIEDLVSRYVQLKKVGANYRGLSPFKHEKTPSFYVYPDKNFYYCFSTSQGGDIFKFVQTKENMSFVEAAEFIADRFGIRLEYERGAKAGAGSSVRKQIFDINEDAAAYYSAEFFAKNPRAESVRNYWTQERKFTLENAKELRIGFSPTDAEGLKKILAKKNYSPDALRECGLFFARESEADLARFHPRFRGRLMIPISDGQGRVIAFTARKTEFTPSDIAYEEGKYVNSPETPVFKKNMTLFNFDRAKKEAERRGYFILAEGQLDTIRMYCSGLENTVASQGTAAGAEHFALMKRHAEILRPKFQCVLRWLDSEIAPLEIASWQRPKGGYFVSVNTKPGLAKRTLALCKEAGVVMTGAGATFPYGKDPQNSNIRIAPSLPPVEELEQAMDVFCTCLKLAALEQLAQ